MNICNVFQQIKEVWKQTLFFLLSYSASKCTFIHHFIFNFILFTSIAQAVIFSHSFMFPSLLHSTYLFIYFHVRYLLESHYHRLITSLDSTMFSSFYPQISINYSSALSSIIVLLMPPLRLNTSAIFSIRMQLRR